MPMEIGSYLERFQDRCRERFEEQQQIKSFQEYLQDFAANPYLYLRTAPQYTVDMFEYFGSYEVHRIGAQDTRWRLFDLEFDNPFDGLVGQERVQNDIYRQLTQAAQRGRSDKMLLLHGPNGSAKSTSVECLFRALAEYSRQPEGALYCFNWIFSEKDEHGGRIGFDPSEPVNEDEPDSYARLLPAEISARIPCELRDPPLFLIPKKDRAAFIEDVIASCSEEEQEKIRGLNYQYFLNGELSPMTQSIYEALLSSYQGNWADLIRHIQVERYFISRRYRRGAISIEPQGNVDAATRSLNYEPTIHLPAVLKSLPMIEAVGDLVDANHGMLEFSDFLKRPLETNKYLLTTSEKGTIHLSNYTAYLDLIITGTANEKQLALFKRNPDFSSFKGRIELISVPYLLRYSKEAVLYERQIELYSKGRHVTPHTATVAALWAVLTRLRRPSAKNYPPELAPIVARLTPMEKAKLYDHGELPQELKNDELKLLQANIRTIRDELNEAEGEFEGIYGAEYEGRRGASPREMISLLGDAAESRQYGCLTPMAVFEQLENLVKDTAVYEFLRIPIDNGYNDCPRFIEDVKQTYAELVRQEVYDCIGLVEEQEYVRVFEEYFHHVKAYDLGEKLFLPSRGDYVDPSEDLMGRIEGLLDLNEPVDSFRSNLITKIAAFSIDHPDEPIRYRELFPEIYNKLKRSFYQERDRTLTLVEQNILRYGTDDFEYLGKEDQEQVSRAMSKMKTKYKYCDNCAKDVIAFVLRSR